MKVLTLTFSSTGNTVVAMNHVENQLVKTGKIDVVHFDATYLAKIICFNRATTPKGTPAAENAKAEYIETFKKEMAQADVIGVGSFAYDMLPPSGAYELFHSEVFTPELFSNIKYFFSVETFGGMPTSGPGMLYSLILEKNPNVQPLGKVGSRAPDSAVLYLAPKGNPDGWIESDLAKFDAFGAELAANLTSGNITPVEVKAETVPEFSQFTATYNSMKAHDNCVKINTTTCIGCGTCERMCPYNIIELHPRPAPAADEPAPAKKPSPRVAVVAYPDECRLCGRCINWCPTGAICAPYHQTDKREHHKAVSIAVMNKPPFSPGFTATDPSKTLLTPARFGTLPTIPQMMIRSKNRLDITEVPTPTVTLSNGVEMPQLGLGVYTIPPGEETYRVVDAALKVPYKKIDTAHAYYNERDVGRAVKDSGIPREQIWITSKLWPTEYGEGVTAAAIDKMLARLDTPYLDLILLHQPVFDYMGAWKDLEKAYEEKKVRAIGISNFDYSEELLTNFLSSVRIKPHVLQIECHPYAQRLALREICAKHNIAVECWFPFGGRGGVAKLLSDPVVTEIATEMDIFPAQVVLAWELQSGLCPLPGTTSDAHLAFNFVAPLFHLSPSQMERMNALNKEDRMMKFDLAAAVEFVKGYKKPED